MKKAVVGIAIAAILVIGGWTILRNSGGSEAEIEYRYAPVEKGELVRSISATGTVVALTAVDVKSKAGGIVTRLAVDEGARVKKGDLIAIIDPRDTEAIYDQAMADLQSAQARANQAKSNYQLQVATSKTTIADAQAALQSAKSRLARAQLEAKRQPTLSTSSVQSAQAALASVQENRARYENIEAPQLRRDAQGALARSKAELETADAELRRQQDLLQRGYVSQAAVDRARSARAAAEASYNTAQQRSTTLEREISAQIRSLNLEVDRANAALNQAKAQSSDVAVSRQTVVEAQQAVRQAEIDLQQARDNTLNNAIRRSEIQAAQAGTVRSRVSAKNARVQLESTTVTAPRDGVVTLKYLEEGTIVPPGTSTFSQGTSIVQLSDTTRMFVDCTVDEADIGEVKEQQKVRIVTEAYPGERLDGVVTRISPAAVTANNITSVKVRVEVISKSRDRLLPGLNATCEFITLSKPNVLLLPSQAVENEGGKSYVKVKNPAKDMPPIRKEVKVGEGGNNGVEILEGLAEGDEVVVAELDLKALRETQQKMIEAQQGGGLAGGQMGPRRPTGGGGTGGRGASGAGGARGGAGGGMGGAGGAGGGARGGGGAGGGGR